MSRVAYSEVRASVGDFGWSEGISRLVRGWWSVHDPVSRIRYCLFVCVVFHDFEADFEASRGDISLIFSIAGFLYFSLGAVSGPLSDRLGARPVVAFGIILIALGLLMASFAISLWQVYLTYGAAVGVGIGFSYVPSVGVLQRWFVRRRGLATGLAVCGYRRGHFGCTTFMPLTGGEFGLA